MSVNLIAAQDDIDSNGILKQEILKIRDNDIYLGEKDAKVVIINYSSLSCPHCADFHKNVFPKLKQNYIDEGKVLYIIRDFPSNAMTLYISHILVDNSSIEQKFSFIESLYNSQMYWVLAKDYKVAINSIAILSGIDEKHVHSIEITGESNEKILEDLYNDNKILQINSMPTVYINGEFFRYVKSYEKLHEHLDAILAQES